MSIVQGRLKQEARGPPRPGDFSWWLVTAPRVCQQLVILGNPMFMHSRGPRGAVADLLEVPEKCNAVWCSCWTFSQGLLSVPVTLEAELSAI